MGHTTKQIIAVPLEEGGPLIYAEIDSDESSGDGDAFGRVSDAVEQLEGVSRSVRDALKDVIVPAARTVFAELRKLDPGQVELEFGIKLSGKAGLLLAEAAGEAHMQVKLSWPRRGPEAPVA